MLKHADLFSQITALDTELYLQVVEIVMNFQTKEKHLEKDKRLVVNSHIFTRAIAIHVPELKVVDGYYIGINSPSKKCSLTQTEHSWLMTPNRCIIETSAIGFLSVTPVLIPTSGKLTHAQANAYKTDVKLGKEIASKVMTPSAKKKLGIVQNRLSKCF